MRAGKLNKLVVIERMDETLNDLGEGEQTWHEINRAWAGIRPLSARETLIATQNQSVISHVITMRYTADVIPLITRLRWNNRIFNVQAVINIDERDREMQLMATEKYGEIVG